MPQQRCLQSRGAAGGRFLGLHTEDRKRALYALILPVRQVSFGNDERDPGGEGAGEAAAAGGTRHNADGGAGRQALKCDLRTGSFKFAQVRGAYPGWCSTSSPWPALLGCSAAEPDANSHAIFYKRQKAGLVQHVLDDRHLELNTAEMLDTEDMLLFWHRRTRTRAWRRRRGTPRPRTRAAAALGRTTRSTTSRCCRGPATAAAGSRAPRVGAFAGCRTLAPDMQLRWG